MPTLLAILMFIFVSLVLWDHFRRLDRMLPPAAAPAPALPDPVDLHAAAHQPNPLLAQLDELLAARLQPARPKLSSRLQSFLVPVVGGAILATVGGIFNYNATSASTQAQLADGAKERAAIIAQIAAIQLTLDHLHETYVPRMEHQHDDEIRKQTREEDEERFARRQAIIDQVHKPR